MKNDRPTRLYKYQPPDRISSIENRLLRFSQPGVFNDPFELRAVISATHQDDALIEQVNLRGIAELAAKTSPQLARLNPTQKNQWIARTVARAKEKLRLALPAAQNAVFDLINHRDLVASANKSLGILCLSSTATNLLMWGHYTSSYAGFVVEFDATHDFFSCPPDAHASAGTLTKVNYLDNRPTILLDKVTDDCVAQLLFSKAKNWKYEQEWRLVRRLASANSVLPGKPLDIHLFEIPPTAITAVVVGHRMSKENFETVRAILTSPLYQHIALKRIQIHASKYSLTIEDATSWESLDSDASRSAIAQATLDSNSTDNRW